jgi:ribA/ribD-fused uncharacterized protein
MAAGFPLSVRTETGVHAARTSEALYQAMRFPTEPDVQKAILEERSPMSAKMVAKKYCERTRFDWEVEVEGARPVRIQAMEWVLWSKLAQHRETWGAVLEETQTLPIVERSRRDRFWGAVLEETTGILYGENRLGRMLSELRTAHRSHSLETPFPVRLPTWKDSLLFGKPILGLP